MTIRVLNFNEELKGMAKDDDDKLLCRSWVIDLSTPEESWGLLCTYRVKESFIKVTHLNNNN